MIVVGLLSGSLAATVLLTYVSVENYPGGHALSQFNRRYEPEAFGALICIDVASTPLTVIASAVHVHISNYAAQSGASLFLQERAPPMRYLTQRGEVNAVWVYNKTEGLTPDDLWKGPFTHAIVEDWTAERYPSQRWACVAAIPGFGGMRLRDASRRGLARYIPSISMPDKLWILERK